MVSNSTLRENSRIQLGGGIFKNHWLMITLVCFLCSAILGAVSATYVGALLVGGPLTYGLVRVILNKIEYPDKEVQLEGLFKGFTECFGQSFLLYLLQSVFTFLWSLLFVIPGIVKSYSYSMAMYILQDSSNKEWKECLNESMSMMDGYKWQLFCLDLSFIGWYIVGAICFGVGIFFAEAYHQTARANFYLALKAKRGIENEIKEIPAPVEAPVNEPAEAPTEENPDNE